MITPEQKRIIQAVVNVFETGKVEGDYGAVSIYPDGPRGIRQVTYGRSQTTEFSHLWKLLEMYAEAGGKYAPTLLTSKDMFYKGLLADDAVFIATLKQAGDDPIMRRCQDRLFDEAYWTPAEEWASYEGFSLPLSHLVIYDSFVHSGRVPMFLRNRFEEKTPIARGDEKVWVWEYVNTRHHWLATHGNKLLQKTIYRTACFQRQISEDNWKLEKLPIDANGVMVS